MGIPDRHILDRYLKNTCTEEERQLVDDWYDQLNIEVPNESLISEEERAAVKAEVWEGVSTHTIPAGRSKWRRRIGWQAAVAAAIFGAVVLSMNWWEHNAHRDTIMVQQRAQRWDTVTAKAGRILHLTLDDGTQVWLKAGSTITYPQHFAASERTVALLNGEAFLDVTKDNKRPFTLTSGECVTRVLGTTFNVRRYKSGKDLAVSVISGKVQVAIASGERKVLDAGREMVKVNESNYVVKDIPPAAMRGAWKNGEMVFRQQAFREIAAELEDYYAIKVNFKDEQLAKLRITGRFSYYQSADEILRLLCMVNGNKFIKEGNNYTISE